MKTKQIEEHEKLKPVEVAQPTEVLDPTQRQAAEGLVAVSQKMDAVRKRVPEVAAENTDLAKQLKAIANIREQLRLLQRTFDQAQQNVSDDLKMLGTTWPTLA